MGIVWPTFVGGFNAAASRSAQTLTFRCSEVVFSGVTVESVIAANVNNLTVTAMSGATLDAGGTRAIHLRNNANVTVHSTALVVASPGSVDDQVIRIASNGIVSLDGVVRALAVGDTVSVGFDSVASVAGQLDVSFGWLGGVYFIQQGATAGYASGVSYLSSAGTVASVSLSPPVFSAVQRAGQPGAGRGRVCRRGLFHGFSDVFSGGLDYRQSRHHWWASGWFRGGVIESSAAPVR